MPKIPVTRRKYQIITNPGGGLDIDNPTTMIDDKKTPDCSEVVFRNGVIEKTIGESDFCNTTTGLLSAGVPMQIDLWKNTAGVSYGCLLCTGTGFKYTVATTGRYIAFTGPLGQDFTGDHDDSFTSAVMNDILAFSNNVTQGIYKWKGDAFVTQLTGATTYCTKKLITYGERMCLLNVTEGGSKYPQRVRWAVAGSCEDYTGTGSGFSDLKSVFEGDEIVAAEYLSSYVVIYGKKTIATMEYKNDVLEPFIFSQKVRNRGCVAPKAIANCGQYHLFLGAEDIYAYDGGREAVSFGNGIGAYVFSIINPEHAHKSFMIFDKVNNEVTLYIPTGANTSPDTYFKINLDDRSWTMGKRSHTCAGYFESQDQTTWDAMSLSWDTCTKRWDDSILQQLNPIILYGSIYNSNSGVVTAEDPLTFNLTGTGINSYWTTKDFVLGDGYEREPTAWMEMNFEACGNTIGVDYSTDMGNTWKTGSTFTLASDWDLYNLDIEAYSPHIRFKFYNSNSSQYFNLRTVEIGYLETSDRGH